MNTVTFWNVIAHYNTETIAVQGILFILMTGSIFLAYWKKIFFLPKLSFAVNFLFLGTVFFLYYGTEPIQTFFAAPLFIACGILLMYEAFKNKADAIQKPTVPTMILLVVALLYPFISYLLGNVYPTATLYIMPCPMVSLSLLVYSCYNKKNNLLFVLFILWGMTGIKSLFFNVYEDLILLACGIYGIYLMVKERKKQNNLQNHTI